MQIGTLEVAKDDGAVVQIPIFDVGDPADSSLRIGLGGGTKGAFSLVDPSKAAFPWLRISKGGGVVMAFHDKVSVEPDADFIFSPSNPDVRDTIDFFDQSTDFDGSIQAWSWDFDDGATSSQEDPSHNYGLTGTFGVQLTVTDDTGLTDSVTKTVSVSPFIIEDWESGSLSPWATPDENGAFGTSRASIVQSPVKHGSNSVTLSEGEPEADEEDIVRIEADPNEIPSPQPSEIFAWWIYVSVDKATEVGFEFKRDPATTTNLSDGWSVIVEPLNEDLVFGYSNRSAGVGFVELARGGISNWGYAEWFDLEVEWNDNTNEILVRMYNAVGARVAGDLVVSTSQPNAPNGNTIALFGTFTAEGDPNEREAYFCDYIRVLGDVN